MTPEDALRQEANWQGQAYGADAEMKVRSKTFAPRDDRRRLQCPRCWVKFGMRSGMTSIPSGGDDCDLLRCDVCGCEAVIPL